MTLTPRFKITNAITAALTKIERARGFLDAARLSEEWIAGMQARALVLEAHYTTHIEGTHLTVEQSERLLADQPVPEADPDESRELLNYRSAFGLVAGYLGSEKPVTERLIRDIHKRLVEDVRGDAASPGKYRTIPNYVVDGRGEVVYTPPAPKEVPRLMAELVSWLNSGNEIHPVLMAGIAQFQLVDIHPFRDGNGRAARLLSTLCLYRSGYDFKRLFTLSEYYDRDRAAYYRAIRSVREHNMDLTDWLEYFTSGLATQMREVQERGKRAARLDLVLVKASKAGLKERPLAVLGYLFDRGKGTVAQMEAAINMNRRTLQRDLKLLEEKGFVREVGTGPTDPTKYYEPLL